MGLIMEDNNDIKKLFVRMAQKLACAKGELAMLKLSDYQTYSKIRDYLDDCQELMALHLDVAPIRLIKGNLID
jgi:uncharacterized protein YaiL (DUF2058 family)